MGVPTDEELRMALDEAARLRESGEDEYYLGKTLLNHNYRLGLLENVLVAARRYLHSGESSRAHTELKRTIDKAERAVGASSEERPTGGPL